MEIQSHEQSSLGSEWSAFFCSEVLFWQGRWQEDKQVGLWETQHVCLQGVPDDGLGIRLVNLRFHGPREFQAGSGPLPLFANDAVQPSGEALSQACLSALHISCMIH